MQDDTSIRGAERGKLDDVRPSQRGIFAFQLHSGGAIKVRFEEIELKGTKD